jgi:hypothetical protein
MAEAATHAGGKRGKGGDLLYRWGNTANYGMSGSYQLECLHSTTWIPEGYPGAGHILFFHNNSTVMKSEVIEIAPPMDANGAFQYTAGQVFGPEQPTWKFSTEDDFYSPYMSSTMRMPNGNTIIHEAYPQTSYFLMKTKASVTDTASASRLWEVTKDNAVVWKHRLSIVSGLEGGIVGGFEQVFNPAKIMYYPSSYIGVTRLLERKAHSKVSAMGTARLFPRIIFNRTARTVEFSDVAGCEVGLYSSQGKKVASATSKTDWFGMNVRRLPCGVYFAKAAMKGRAATQRSITIMP